MNMIKNITNTYCFKMASALMLYKMEAVMVHAVHLCKMDPFQLIKSHSDPCKTQKI